MHLGTGNRSTCVEGEYIAHQWRVYALYFDVVGNLDDWILFGFWEETFAPCALDIEAEDPKRADL